jgi:hypothetical protein
VTVKIVTSNPLPVCACLISLQWIAVVAAVSNESDTYFPKFSPSSSVSGSSVFAVSGRKMHSKAPSSGNTPNVRGGTNTPNIFYNRNERKVQRENHLISE